MHNYTLIIVTLCARFMTASAETAPEWRFDDHYFDGHRFLQLHAAYAVPPEWQRAVDMAGPTKSTIAVNFGSLTVDDLMTVADVSVRAPLGYGFGARYRYLWRSGPHREIEERRNLLGFDKHLFGPLSVFSLGDFSTDKEDIDILWGISVCDSTGSRFMEMALIDQDHFHDEKNALGGVTKAAPLGIIWTLGNRLGPLAIRSEGVLSRGFERSYGDSALSPSLRAHSRRVGRSVTRGHWHATSRLLTQVELSHYSFSEHKGFRDSTLDYSYANTIVRAGIASVLRITARHSVRLALDGVSQRADARGRRSYAFERRDLIPSLLYELRVWRFGVTGMGAIAFYRAVLDSYDMTADRTVRNRLGKVQFGARFEISSSAHVLFAWSHDIDPDGFNGMNGQFLTVF